MLRESTRHLAAASALAFAGSVLVGSLVGLPSALAESGLASSDPAARGLSTLDADAVALNTEAIVAGESVISVSAVSAGTPPVQVVASVPALPLTLGTSTVTTAPPTAGALGIPGPLLDAYKRAADQKNASSQCEIDWSLLAAIGKVESDHAQGGKVDEVGNTRGVIEGPSTRYGTAKGPMQFLDSSWKMFGADGNGDGVKDVNNIYDAALGAANHLCASGKGSLQDPQNLHDAIFGYNHAEWYVAKVIDWASQYSGRAVPVAAAEGDITSSAPAPVAPPAPEPVDPPDPTTEPSTPSTEPTTPTTSPSEPTTPSDPITPDPSVTGQLPEVGVIPPGKPTP